MREPHTEFIEIEHSDSHVNRHTKMLFMTGNTNLAPNIKPQGLKLYLLKRSRCCSGISGRSHHSSGRATPRVSSTRAATR